MALCGSEMLESAASLPSTTQLALREAARRLLRVPESMVRVPVELGSQASKMILQISDFQPGRHLEPEVVIAPGSTSVCVFTGKKKCVQLAGPEPDAEVCWIPGSLDVIWTEFSRYVAALAQAGYPGCIGCGGADAELPWDEMYRRSEMLGT